MPKPETTTVDLDEKLADLMGLSPENRIRLAERLIESVPSFASPEIERAWNEEIARRIEDHERGRDPGIPAEEVFADIEQRLSQKSSGTARQ
jgi:putative addiction module component (TIGR02574 family)